MRHADAPNIEFQYELAVINEECGEVIQIAGKTLRFGWFSKNPDNQQTNLTLFHNEVGDIMGSVEFAVERGLLNREQLEATKTAKLEKLRTLAPLKTTPLPQQTPQTDVHEVKGALMMAIMIIMLLLVVLAGFFYVSLKPSEKAAEGVPVVSATSPQKTQETPTAPVSDGQKAIVEAAEDCLRKAKALGSPGSECSAIVELARR